MAIPRNYIFVDFETAYDTKAGFDLKSMSMTEYIRDPRFKVFGAAYSLNGAKAYWTDSRLPGDLDWGKSIVVAHNVKFDGAILAWRYGVRPAGYLDTQCMAKAVLGNNISSYALRSLAEYYGLEPKGSLKTDGKWELTTEEEDDLALYCIHDTELCAQIFNRLIQDFPESQIPLMDWTIRAFIEPKLELNVPILERMVTDEKSRREQAITASGLSKAALSSNKQFAEALTNAGISVPRKTSSRTGHDIAALSLADEGFLALKETHPKLYAGRVAAKSTITETRGENLINVGKTGLFPFDVQFSGAVQTHRFSGSNGAGGNPQNFPRKGPIREAVCAPMGQELVVGDFAAIELRIISWLAKEPRLINPLIHGTRIYSEFGSKIYGRPINKKDNPAEDHVGKTAVLGLGYGMGWEKFQRTANIALDKAFEDGLIPTKQEISEEKAREIVLLYREYYFNIPKLWKQAETCIPLMAAGKLGCLPFAPFIKVEKAALILPSGLKVRYPNLRSRRVLSFGRPKDEWIYDVYKKRYESEGVKLYGGKLIENICQALAGEICKLAISRCLAWNLPMAGQVHDELVAVSDTACEAVVVMKQSMEHPVPFWPELRLKSEVHSGKNWAAAKAA